MAYSHVAMRRSKRRAPALFDILEESIIRTAFAWCRHNQVQTAKVLGISRSSCARISSASV
jgi:sigma-54-specific transcriptional regulator